MAGRGPAQAAAESDPILAVALVIRKDVKRLARCPHTELGLHACSGVRPAVHSLGRVSRGSLGPPALQPN